MAEQTSLVAQQVRLMHWAEQIRESNWGQVHES